MKYFSTLLAIYIIVSCTPYESQDDFLPSWNDSDHKTAIVDFVTSSVDENNDGFIPTAERIAVFDNDGTLWAEQPLYFQLFYVIDQIKAMADQHPEWDTLMPFAAGTS